MPKHKFNLVGNTFNYEDAPRCSVWGKESKFTEWVDEGGDGTFSKLLKAMKSARELQSQPTQR